MNPSFGSGSALLGGTSPLQQVMAQGGPALNQQSPASAGFNPSMVPPAPPTSSAMPQISSPQPQEQALPPEMGQLPITKSDTEIILAALTEKLKSESKIKEAQSLPPKQPSLSVPAF